MNRADAIELLREAERGGPRETLEVLVEVVRDGPPFPLLPAMSPGDKLWATLVVEAQRERDAYKAQLDQIEADRKWREEEKRDEPRKA